MEPAWEIVTDSKFAVSEYKDKTGRSLPCYSLTKTECLYIATKFNDEARAVSKETFFEAEFPMLIIQCVMEEVKGES